MSFYTRAAFRYFSRYSEKISLFFPDLKIDLKKARMKTSPQEYISTSMLTTFLVFLLEVPLLAFAFGFIFHDFLFSFIAGFATSILLSVLIFFLFTKYPKTIISEKAKKLDNALPFASLYFSTIAGTKLPLHKVFRIFGKFSRYDEVKDEIDMINKDIETFGFDVNTSLERAVERTPSKSFRELIWGLLSTSISGGNISIFLREKSEELIGDYRRKLEEFSKKMMLFSEIYLTAIILGTIFFVILTSIFSGISGAGTNMILLQTLIIFVFLPLLSLGLIVLIKSATPGGE